MKSKMARIILSLALLASALVGVLNASPALADAPPQTSLTIIKYAPNGTVLANTTVTYEWMRDNLTVQGDGTTHYYTEGPTFDPANLWDPDELCPRDSLKDKGALKGTDLKDLCNLVGGAVHGDAIKVKASDGYNEIFDYENVYTPVARQGPIVICWWKDGQYTGAWSEGMLLAFFTTVGRTSDGKLLFGHQDMHDCLPESNWHWYYDNSIQYPSTHGLWIKYISEISVYSGGTEGWSVDVSGHLEDTVPQNWFENAIACHHMGATYVDSGNNTWQGLPLWYMCGLVDDGNIHGAGAFNDAVAEADYTVKIVGSGNSSFSSLTVARNNNIILANTLNGDPLSSEYYPLRLVGADVDGGLGIGNTTRIELQNLPPVITASSIGSGGSISPDGDIVLSPGASQVFNITANSGYHISDVLVDGVSVGAVSTYTFNDVTGYHTIVSYIVGDTCIITASAGAGGGISPTGAVAVNYGNSQLFTITPNPGYRIVNVLVDSSSVGAVSSYTFTSVSTAHTISASFIPAWDINGDHVCDIGDVVKIGLVWGQTGSNGWIVEDVSPDGVIDIGDVVVIGLKWGKTW